MSKFELTVGTTLQFKDIPNDDNLSIVALQEDLDELVEMLGLPMGTYTGALVEKADLQYTTIWLSTERRSFDLHAAYLLVKLQDRVFSVQ